MAAFILDLADISNGQTALVGGKAAKQMGMALHDVALVAGRFPEVVSYLEKVTGKGEEADFLTGLSDVAGWGEVRGILEGFLTQFGMRCPGEIDISKPRWLERPGNLAPLLLSDIAAADRRPSAELFAEGARRGRRRRSESWNSCGTNPADSARPAKQRNGFASGGRYRASANILNSI